MKRICLYMVMMLVGCQLSAQTYDELISRAMSAVEADSLYQAESLFKKALQKEPANLRNALLFSNLGTIQRRMGKNKEALESYSLALNLTPYSKTMLLNRASLYLEMDYLDKAYVDYCNVIDLDASFVLIFICVVGNIKMQGMIIKAYWRLYLVTRPPGLVWRWSIKNCNAIGNRWKSSIV